MVMVSGSPEIAVDESLAHWLADLEKQAHHASIHSPTPHIAGVMQELLGQRLVAAMTGIGDEKTVGRWARGEREPRGESERRMRDAFQIVSLLSLADSPAMARAWFVGMNPHLRDRAPFAVLSETPESASQVLAAAKAFVVNG
ncbi:MAG: XRE family transcriptional regulator [Chloroflexota bacterium]|nr:XRE family transcriptional regulator [Chloroflexota bacterium]